jgi:hypothetical protein
LTTASSSDTASIQASCNAAIAKKFLTDILANGPVPMTEIDEAAKANGIAERALCRAKSE